MSEPRRVNDPDVLKGLAHPLRQRLYRLLIQLGPATVTLLAGRMDADPGQISYHLRELGRRGFIEEAPELARDRRERWWRVVPGSISWSTAEFEEPAARAVAETLHQQQVADQFQRLRAYEADKDSWGPDWAGAAVSSNSYLRLTPQELGDLSDELNAVLRRWADKGRAGRDVRPEDRPQDGRTNVLLFFHAFPEEP
jgi:DNA-binding transcriptional ArsR family regulator